MPTRTRATLLGATAISFVFTARPAAAVTGLVQASGKTVTSFTHCKRTNASLTLPVRFLSATRLEASFGSACHAR